MLGILVVFGVPAIIGGGLTFHIFHSWIAVILWEALVVVGAVTIAFKTAGKSAPSSH